MITIGGMNILLLNILGDCDRLNFFSGITDIPYRKFNIDQEFKPILHFSKYIFL